MNGDESIRSADTNAAVKAQFDTVEELYARQQANTSSTQGVIEALSAIFSHPVYFACLILLVLVWVILNEYAEVFSMPVFDARPFVLLQGIVGFNCLLITIAVLVRQNRLTRMEEKRAHLTLQAALLAEQKTSKIIQLLEELRHDLPNVQDRIDPEAEALQRKTDHRSMLDDIDQKTQEKSGDVAVPRSTTHRET